MAAMFYSLQEAAERLGTTEANIREIVQSGQLREFRDGPNLLFKVDEVNALAPQAGQVAPQAPAPQPPQPLPPQAEIPLELDIPQAPAPQPPQPLPPQAEIPLELDIPQAPAPQPPQPLPPQAEIPVEPDVPQTFEPAEPQLEIPLEMDAPQAQAPQPEMPELQIPETPAPELEPPAELEPPQMEMPEAAAPALEIPAEPEPLDMDISDLEIDEQAVEIAPESGTSEMGLSDLDIAELDEQIAQGPPAGTSEILLAQSGAPAVPSELTNADTAITGEGVNVRGETDRDYAITDDTLSETVGSLGLASTGTTPDASLEEIEGDVNLDSFGSGSGLLDLSLQADDTSLGGILDEIYTAEDEAVEPADPGTVAEVAAEVDQMDADDELLTPQAALAMPGFGQARFEPAPDKASGILGAMLFVPLLFLVYIAIVTVGGIKGVSPSLLQATKGFIWYIVAGFGVITVGIGLYALFVADKDAAPAKRKPKKPKKAKKKPKKPKKAKK